MKMDRLSACALALLLVVGCADTGGVRKKDLQFDDLPTIVRKGIEVAYPDAHVTKIVQETDRETGLVQYRVQLIDKEGLQKSDLFAPDGTPASVRQEYHPYTKASQ